MPADPILTLAWLVLAHLTADFIVQTSAVVMAKNAPGPRGWWGLGAHGLGVAACLIPVALAFGLPGLWALIAIAVSHMLVDRTKVRLTHGAEHRALDAAERRHEGRAPAAGLGRAWTPLPAAYFAADQLAHLGLTAAAWAIWLSGQAPTVQWSTAITNLFAGRDLAVVHEVILWLVVIAALLIANVRAGALFVATLVRPTELGAEIGALAGEPAAEGPPSGRPPTPGLPPRSRRRPRSSSSRSRRRGPGGAGTSGSGRSPRRSRRRNRHPRRSRSSHRSTRRLPRRPRSGRRSGSSSGC